MEVDTYARLVRHQAQKTTFNHPSFLAVLLFLASAEHALIPLLDKWRAAYLPIRLCALLVVRYDLASVHFHLW